jgi:ATP-dependent Clp endopeptidase proteolytic subunit ClpP
LNVNQVAAQRHKTHLKLLHDIYIEMLQRKRKSVDLQYSIKKNHDKKPKETDSIVLDEDLKEELGLKHSEKKITRDNNHIYFHSEVDRDTIFELCQLIAEAEEENYFTAYKLGVDAIPIYLHISSFGGSVFAAFTAIDVINACKVPVYTIIEGATASAGTLISVFGAKRFIRPNAYMLIHQLSSGFWGKMSEIEDEYKNLAELMERLLTIYKENTKIPKKELHDLLRHDLWLNSDKSLKYGLVDEIYK